MNDLERCKDWIEGALEYSGGTHNYADVVKGIKQKKLQLWPAEDACLVTEIISYPQLKCLNIFLGGGNLKTLKDMHDSVEEFGKMVGCTRFTISGRRGWARVFKGFKPLHQTIVKEI